MRQVERVVAPLDAFEPHPDNPRRVVARNQRALEKSVERFGLVQPPVANVRTGRVVGGHRRLEALRAAGETEVEWIVGDWDEAEERALLVALNAQELQGLWDEDRLATILASVREELPELVRDLGFMPRESVSTSPRVGDLRYEVVVQCDGEGHQRDVVERLEREGLKCRLLIL